MLLEHRFTYCTRHNERIMSVFRCYYGLELYTVEYIYTYCNCLNVAYVGISPRIVFFPIGQIWTRIASKK